MPQPDLFAEAAHFHRCFAASREASPDLLRAYSEALPALGIEPDALTSRLVAARADLVSCEFVARLRRRGGHPLTRRALVTMSLSEARPETSDLFLNPRPARARAWLELALAPFRAASQFANGAMLLWWHGRGL